MVKNHCAVESGLVQLLHTHLDGGSPSTCYRAEGLTQMTLDMMKMDTEPEEHGVINAAGTAIT